MILDQSKTLDNLLNLTTFINEKQHTDLPGAKEIVFIINGKTHYK